MGTSRFFRTTGKILKYRVLNCNFQAGIDPHWCTCLTWESAMGSEQLDTSKMLVNVALEAINSYTEPERKLCAKLNLVILFC